jgi:hypothetical protein
MSDAAKSDQKHKPEGAAGLGTAQPSAAGAAQVMGKTPGGGADPEVSDPTRPINPGAPVGDKNKRG